MSIDARRQGSSCWCWAGVVGGAEIGVFSCTPSTGARTDGTSTRAPGKRSSGDLRSRAQRPVPVSHVVGARPADELRPDRSYVSDDKSNDTQNYGRSQDEETHNECKSTKRVVRNGRVISYIMSPVPKLEPALPRRKKHPDLAYRHHEFLVSDGNAGDRGDINNVDRARVRHIARSSTPLTNTHPTTDQREPSTLNSHFINCQTRQISKPTALLFRGTCRVSGGSFAPALQIRYRRVTHGP